MNVRTWSTREPLETSFESAWQERITSSKQSHFELDLATIAHAARAERPWLAALVEDGERRGALVMREVAGGLVCGWPWRWHAVIERDDPRPAYVLSDDEADWLFDAAETIANGRRLRCYLPRAPRSGAAHFVAGTTYVQGLEASEDQLLKALDPAKRRMIKRAVAQGYTVVDASALEHLRGFASLPKQGTRAATATAPGAARGAGAEAPEPAPAPLPDLGLLPGAGEGWREWEQPWMWLLAALKDGKVEAGSGFGLMARACVDYRTNASSVLAKKDGANVLLAWEAIRRGKERGYAWINWGGATRFKQELGGERIEIVCRLGGGRLWALPNAVAASALRTRGTVAGLIKAGESAVSKRVAARKGAARVKPATPPTLAATWDTEAVLDDGFRERWSALVKRCPQASFVFDVDYLAWEARHGRSALAVVAEHRGARGAMVLRRKGAGWVCGWPWRWQAVIEDPGAKKPPGLAREDAIWLFDAAYAAAKGGRLRCYFPAELPEGRPGFEAGSTILQRLDVADEDLLAAMDPSKRRMVRRAMGLGYEVRDGAHLDDLRRFAEVQFGAFRRRDWKRPKPDGVPAQGEEWREWEHPWMWLLVALKDGRIESGLGDGVLPGGMLEGRAGASTPDGRRDGAFALLCYEEMKRGRDGGHRWLNHGGDTLFKRDVAGRLGARLSMFCWLGGGPVWSVANRSEAWMSRTRPRVASWVRSIRKRSPKRT